MFGWREFSLPCGDQKTEFLEHVLDRAGDTVVPGENTLGGIAPAQKANLGFRAGAAQFARDFDEQATLGHSDFVAAFGSVKHAEPILKSGAFKRFVGIGARHYAQHFIGHFQAGIH